MIEHDGSDQEMEGSKEESLNGKIGPPAMDMWMRKRELSLYNLISVPGGAAKNLLNLHSVHTAFNSQVARRPPPPCGVHTPLGDANNSLCASPPGFTERVGVILWIRRQVVECRGRG